MDQPKEMKKPEDKLNTNDDSRPLGFLFDAKDGQPLYDCRLKKKTSIEVGSKRVLVFITSLDIAKEDSTVMHQMYQEKRACPFNKKSQYEIVWIPFIEEAWSDDKNRQFESLKQKMYWYTVHRPDAVPPVASRYIKDPDTWRFIKKPICVVLDTEGNVVHKNAIPMIRIWGSAAFPFSETKERFFWGKQNWRMDLLTDAAIDMRLTIWIESRRHVCLFGGEDIEWIRKFTGAAKEAASKYKITLELLYLGNSNLNENTLNKINAINEAEKLGFSTIKWGYMWYFWLRIKSMWFSKMQLMEGRVAEIMKTDPIIKGLISMLSFGGRTQGWAVISGGSLEMAMGNAEYMLTAMEEQNKWRTDQGFVAALDEYLMGLSRRIPHQCTSLVLPETGAISETVSCGECCPLMGRVIKIRR